MINLPAGNEKVLFFGICSLLNSITIDCELKSHVKFEAWSIGISTSPIASPSLGRQTRKCEAVVRPKVSMYCDTVETQASII